MKGDIHLYEIRKAECKDVKGIAKVHVDSWWSTYKGIISESYLESLSYQEKENFWKEVPDLNKVYVALHNGDVIGFISYGPSQIDKIDGEIYAFYLLENFQRLGIGKKLFEEAISSLYELGYKSVVVWVFDENPCKAFYEQFQPKKIGEETIEIEKKKHKEIAYGWYDLKHLLQMLRA